MTLEEMSEEYALEAQRRMKETILGCDAWEPLAVAYKAGAREMREMAAREAQFHSHSGACPTTDTCARVIEASIRRIGEE